MRLFVAAVPPPVVLDHLADAVRPVTDDVLRWTDVAAWHITLAFYGEVEETKLAEVSARVGRAARRRPPATIRLTGAGRFGAGVLWVGVVGDVALLRRCAQSMTAVGRRIGAEPDHARFRPHVTLARSRGPVDLRPYVEGLASYTGPEWSVAEVTLLRSHLGTEAGVGPRYEALGRFPLTGVRASPPPPR